MNTEKELTFKPKQTIIFGVSFGSNKIEVHHKDLSSPISKLNFVIAYSGNHARWAEKIQRELEYSLEKAFDGLDFSIELLPLHGSVDDVINILLNHDVLSGSTEMSGHSFVITPGWWESEVVHEARQIGAISVPQLFCVPGSPLSLFERTEDEPEGRRNLGGVYSHPTSPEHYVTNLKAIKPPIKRVCLAYNPHSDHDSLSEIMKCRAADLHEAFAREGIKLITHWWDHKSMRLLELTMKASECDAVITLHEPQAELYSHDVIQMCNDLKIPLCTSELDSVQEGAVLGCGLSGGAFSPPLVSLVCEYLMNPSRGLNWETICIPEQPGAFMNEFAREAQGIEFTKEQEALFKMRSAFKQPDVLY